MGQVTTLIMFVSEHEIGKTQKRFCTDFVQIACLK